MAFELRKDAERWFRHIAAELPTKFDLYYFCLLAGFATGRKSTVKTAETTEIVQQFPATSGCAGGY